MRQIYTSLFKNTIVFSFLLSLLIGWNTHAQVYPVQTNVSTSGPYFNYLSYYGDQNNHLQVITTLVDFNTPPINVRLRFKIQGPGYELYTNPNANITQTYVLESGMPLVLSGIDLLPYLQANTLVNPNNVDLNNLPEGLTTICVDVIRAGTNQEVLSTNNCTLFNLYQFQPPQTFLPQCASMLDTTGLFHTFQWSAPLGYVPDVNSEVRYTFSLYRWQDPSNNTIFVTDQGLVWREYDIQTTQAIVSEFDVQFEQGGLYVWRIEAQVYSDGMPINMIVNNGVSAPCTFTYGEAQTLTDLLGDGLEIQLFTEASSERKGTASWTVIDNTPNQGLSTFDAFFIEYRKQPTGNEGFEIPWFSETLTTLQKFIYQLEPNTSYEVKVSGIIGGVVGDPTPVKIFTTPAARVYACGESDLPFLPATYTPLQNATVGTQVQIGQFTLTMTEVVPLGSAGHYAGKGEIPISFLANARAKVRFEDLLIDTEYRVREGRADVITEGLEAWLDEQYQQFIDPYFVDGTIDSAYVSDSLAWVVVDGVAISFVFDPPNYPVIVNDASGNTYTIYPNGTIIVSSYLAISETWNVGANQVAMFGQNANEIRGFDPKEHMEWYENYETMKLSDNTFYFVANKSMAKGEADQVNVQFPPNVSQMSFELANGTPILVSSLNGAWMGNKPYNDSGLVQTLNIPAFSSAGKYEIFAFANNEKVGQLNINVYSEKTKELIVVPLVANLGVTESQIKAELDRTLGEANINVTVTLSPQWNDTTFTPTYTISLPTEVGALSKYSDDMRELRDAYFAANPNAAKDKYYLFVVNGFDDPSELGYMVRGRAMGFIAGSQSNILETISHELGHGMGALEHSWKNNGPSQGSTDNLMDYGANAPKNNLTKAQWKELRDADVLPSLFDDVEDYQFVSVSMSFLSSLKEGDSYTFIRPNGSLISLPSNTQSVEFSTLDRGISDVSGSETEYLFPVGALLSFQLADGKMYSAKSSGSYYWVEDNASEYIDTITSSKNYTYAITHFTGIQNNKIVNYYFPVSQSSANELTSQANYIIFDNQNISWDLTPVQFVTSYMPQGFSGSYLNDEGNSEIQIGGQNWFNTVTYNVGNGILKNVNELTIEDLFIQAAGTEPSVKDIIHYLLFINAHRAAFDGYVQCFEDYNANELSMQDARTEQMIIRQQYIHSGNMADATAAKQAVTDFKQATVQKIVDKLIESNLSQDLSNLSGLISSQQSDGEDIHNWIATNGSCVLGGLTPYNRALGFRKLLQDDEYWDDALLMLEKINEQDYINVSTFINLLVDNPTANWLDIALVQLMTKN